MVIYNNDDDDGDDDYVNAVWYTTNTHSAIHCNRK
jgi:hypothetical protein